MWGRRMKKCHHISCLFTWRREPTCWPRRVGGLLWEGLGCQRVGGEMSYGWFHVFTATRGEREIAGTGCGIGYLCQAGHSNPIVAHDISPYMGDLNWTPWWNGRRSWKLLHSTCSYKCGIGVVNGRTVPFTASVTVQKWWPSLTIKQANVRVMQLTLSFLFSQPNTT